MTGVAVDCTSSQRPDALGSGMNAVRRARAITASVKPTRAGSLLLGGLRSRTPPPPSARGGAAISTPQCDVPGDPAPPVRPSRQRSAALRIGSAHRVNTIAAARTCTRLGGLTAPGGNAGALAEQVERNCAPAQRGHGGGKRGGDGMRVRKAPVLPPTLPLSFHWCTPAWQPDGEGAQPPWAGRSTRSSPRVSVHQHTCSAPPRPSKRPSQAGAWGPGEGI